MFVFFASKIFFLLARPVLCRAHQRKMPRLRIGRPEARQIALVVAVPGSGVPLGGYRWYTVGTVRAVGPWTVDSPVGALVGP